MVTTMSYVGAVAACGGYIDNEAGEGNTAGEITTPGYPANYSNNALCIWLIVAPLGHSIHLELFLQTGSSNLTGCTDILEVGNVQTLTNISVVWYC